MPDPRGTIRLSGCEPAGLVRVNQPVAVGVAFAAGVMRDPRAWRLRSAAGGEVACQLDPLSRWPDGSVQWLRVQFLASAGPGERVEYRLSVGDEAVATSSGCGVRRQSGRLTVATVGGEYELSAGSAELFRRAIPGDGRGRSRSGESAAVAVSSSAAERAVAGWVCRLQYTDRRGRAGRPCVESVELEQAGAVAVCARLGGTLGRRAGLRFTARITFFPAIDDVRLELTLENPRRARHRGGYWDLGDPASVLVREWAVEVRELPAAGAAEPGEGRIVWAERPGEPPEETRGWLEIHQESSGGENWASRNHVNRHGRVPLRYRGYRIRRAAPSGNARLPRDLPLFGDVCEGEPRSYRARPAVAVSAGQQVAGCAPLEFWERFPTAIYAKPDCLQIGLLPEQSADVHEVQGGERCTRVVWLGWGQQLSEVCRRLATYHRPLLLTADAADYAASGAVSCLPHDLAGASPELGTLQQEAMEGARSFFRKRETIDEYGWRNYGDMWADHEQAYFSGTGPVISHHNNQYDLLQSLLVHSLLSGDRRWWELGDALARHILDIDLYHTRRDKAAYNGGLFWHTAHYRDAGTGTHRGFSRKMEPPVVGGGPGNEHNYASGLLLYYYLTGDPRARQAVQGLADWVLAMDAGQRHVLGMLSDAPTGYATNTGMGGGLQDLGRGAGNSIQTLLDGWLLTQQEEYWEKAGEFIRRTVHPADDVFARELHDAEERWSYTVYLQALLRFLRLAEQAGRCDGMYDYTRESLLRYARWMAVHERRYLDHPERLEYPTETWPAQELRKGTVLWRAARYAEDESERDLFQRQADRILDWAWRDLMVFATRACTRPLALALQQGYLEAYARTSLGKTTSPCGMPVVRDGGFWFEGTQPAEFVPQKQAIRRSWGTPRQLLRMLAGSLQPQRWRPWLQTWAVQRVQQWLGQ